MSESARAAAEEFVRLVTIMSTLRGPDGCPWDREQTIDSLKPFVLEEAYEVIEAIDRHDHDGLREELGDFVFEAVFLAQLEAEAGHFTIADSLKAVADKLVRRHPHVFKRHEGEAPIDSAGRVKTRWEEIKAEERASSGEGTRKTLLSGIAPALPALLRAYQIGTRAASVGFDWPRTTDVMDKIEEEVAELRAELDHEEKGSHEGHKAHDGKSNHKDHKGKSNHKDHEDHEEKSNHKGHKDREEKSNHKGHKDREDKSNHEEHKHHKGKSDHEARQDHEEGHDKGIGGPTPERARVEEEMGDLLFAIANLARKIGIEPETALRKANDKFTRRFTMMEKTIVARGQSMAQLSLGDLEEHWQLAKTDHDGQKL